MGERIQESMIAHKIVPVNPIRFTRGFDISDHHKRLEVKTTWMIDKTKDRREMNKLCVSKSHIDCWVLKLLVARDLSCYPFDSVHNLSRHPLRW